MSVQKRYFWVTMDSAEKTSTGYRIRFPSAFCSSMNPRQIIVMECMATYKHTLVGDIVMHADFIIDDYWFDHAVCFINKEPNRKTAKYDYNSYKQEFNFWFTDLKGVSVNNDIDAFGMRLLLIY